MERKSSLPLRSKTLEGLFGILFRYEHSGETAGCCLCHSSRRFSTFLGIVFLGPSKCSVSMDDVDEVWFSLAVLVVSSFSTEPSEESSSLSSSSAPCRLYISHVSKGFIWKVNGSYIWSFESSSCSSDLTRPGNIET